MGRLIDADVLREEVNSWGMNDYEPSDFTDAIDDVPTVEAISKADYENRLKSDLEAILTELQLEIEELDSRAGYSGDGMPTFSTDYIRKKKVNELVQQKIDALKENAEESRVEVLYDKALAGIRNYAKSKEGENNGIHEN